MDERINVAVLIYPGVEVMDMNGPIDVFVKANQYTGGKYRVYTVAESADDVASELSVVRMIPEYTLHNCPPPDIIVIPGQIMPEGSKTSFGTGSDELLDWIKKQAKHPEITLMAVCVGVYILAHTGLLTGRKATTHWGAISSIRQEYPGTTFIENVRFVADQNFISTGGVTSGIDAALYLIGIRDGDPIAKRVADIMVYNREAPLPPDTILP